MKRTSFMVIAAVAAAITLGLHAAPAKATTVSFFNNPSSEGTLRFTIGCGSMEGDCTGLLEVLMTDSESEDGTVYNSEVTPLTGIIGGMFELKNSGLATELSFANDNILDGDSFASGKKTNRGGEKSYNFTTSAEYIIFKIGRKPSHALIHNLGGPLDLYFNGTDGTGSGLSHYTEYGSVAAVPLPASALLLLSGLLGLGLFGRRRRAATA